MLRAARCGSVAWPLQLTGSALETPDNDVEVLDTTGVDCYTAFTNHYTHRNVKSCYV